MTSSEKFRKFAAECKSMAKFTHDPNNREAWNQMAERWSRCADTFDAAAMHAREPAKRQYRKPAHRWSQ